MKSFDALQWEAVNLKHKQSGKVILRNMSGLVKSGDFLCVMGPSGAGKSSLLSILTGRICKSTRNFELEGSITMNKQEYDGYKFGKFAAYVRQDDILLGTLTVRETFSFQIQVRYPKASEEEKTYRVNTMLKKLSLEECSEVMVGDSFSKAISGGQKKRVAIGVELLSDPTCLILDEPTSGLDSTISLKLINTLKSLAKEGKIIITTIHQPSSLIFQQMDQLLLLKNGETVYQGQASSIVPYMKHIGVNINLRMNPADFFMMEISDYNKNNQQTLMTHQKYEGFRATQPSPPLEGEIKEGLPVNEERQRDCLAEGRALTGRSFKNFYRMPSNIYGKLVTCILVPFLLSTLYWNKANNIPDVLDPNFQQFLGDLASFVFMSVFFSFAMNVYDTVLVFPAQKELIFKETSANLYSFAVYFVCRCLIQWPSSIIASVFSSTIIYWAVNFQMSFYNFFFYGTLFSELVIVFVLEGMVGNIFGMCVGVLFSTGEVAIQLLPLIMIPILLYGGLVVNLNDIPEYNRWLQYLSPIRHGYSSVMINQLHTDKLHNIGEYEFVVRMAGVNGTIEENILMLGGLFVFFFFSCILILYIKKKSV